MDRTELLRGKENVEHPVNVRTSEHATKVRQARDARRKRILARSSERLAFITGEANAIPTSPLLDYNKSNGLIPPYPNSVLNYDGHYSSDHERTIKKSLSFNDYEHRGTHIKLVNTSKAEDAVVHQPSENTETKEASKEQAQQESMNEEYKSEFSNCIKRSLLPRFICATFIAVAFLATGFVQGSIYYPPSTFGFARSGHLGREDIIFVVCYSLAIVILVEFLFMGAFFFFLGTGHLKMVRNGKATLSTLWHFLLSISLDCSVSVSLLFGGFFVLSKYFPSHFS